MPSIDDLTSGVVREAHQWVGTPYRHQQRAKGRGVDCVGLILGVGEAAGVMPATGSAWAPYARYGRLPNPTRFMRGVAEFLRPFGRATEGGVVVLQWRDGYPMHLGILDATDDGWYLTHAFEHRDRCVRHALDDEWRDRIHSFWLYPAIADLM